MHLAIVILFKFLSIKIPLHINRDWGGQDCSVDVVLALHINNIKLRTTLSLSLFSICRQRKWRRNWTSRLLHPLSSAGRCSLSPVLCPAPLPRLHPPLSSVTLFRTHFWSPSPGWTSCTPQNTPWRTHSLSDLDPPWTLTRPSWTAPRTMGWTSHQGACRRLFPTMV